MLAPAARTSYPLGNLPLENSGTKLNCRSLPRSIAGASSFERTIIFLINRKLCSIYEILSKWVAWLLNKFRERRKNAAGGRIFASGNSLINLLGSLGDEVGEIKIDLLNRWPRGWQENDEYYYPDKVAFEKIKQGEE